MAKAGETAGICGVNSGLIFEVASHRRQALSLEQARL
jgi:hypothetical protein